MESFKYIPNNPLNFYCDVNINNICRVCLEKSQANKKMCSIFDEVEPLHSMIMSCASVQILQGDGLPNTICQKCLAKLNIAWQFKLQCESSDSRLRQFYTNSNILQIVPESTDSFNDLTKKDENFLNPVEETCMETKFLSEHMKLENNNYNSTKNKNKIGRTKSYNKDSKIHQCDTCGKIFNRREYLTQHIRIHTGEKPYCCHICEKRFVNSGHLTTHMRTHTGERPHICTICPKAFSTKQELNKHIMVHNGERPFICNTCGKCFGSSSNLYSHLKHHTGEKNFTCEHCGKAFYTKQELKQHSVVHTGEKAFLCDFCNKRFSQSAHLRRHLKLHV